MPVTGSFPTPMLLNLSVRGTGLRSLALLDLLDGCLGNRISRIFAMLMQRWFPSVPAWIFAAFFALGDFWD